MGSKERSRHVPSTLGLENICYNKFSCFISFIIDYFFNIYYLLIHPMRRTFLSHDSVKLQTCRVNIKVMCYVAFIRWMEALMTF